MRDVVFAARVRYASHLTCPGSRFECTAEQLQMVSVAQVNGRGTIATHVVHVLRGCQQLEKLHHPRRPAGYVARELLQRGSGALAAPLGQRVGYTSALAERVATARQQPADAHQ